MAKMVFLFFIRSCNYMYCVYTVRVHTKPGPQIHSLPSFYYQLLKIPYKPRKGCYSNVRTIKKLNVHGERTDINIFLLYFYQKLWLFADNIVVFRTFIFFDLCLCLFANARSQSRSGERHFTSCSTLALPHANVYQKTDCDSFHSYMHAFCKLTFFCYRHISLLLLQLLQQRLIQALETTTKLQLRY